MALDKLEQLRTFISVADTRSFSAAARSLQISTNGVSLRIRQLEEALNVKLFVRTTRSVSLTDEGRLLYARAATLLSDLDELESELDPKNKEPRGTVRVGLPAIIAGTPFLKHLGVLLEKYPHLAVQTRVTNAMVMPASEGLDIVVAAGPPADSSLIAKHIGRASWVLAASPAYARRHGLPKSPEELHRHQCLRLLSNPPQNEWSLVPERAKESGSKGAGREITVPVSGNYQADDSRVLGDAVYAGLGIGVRSARECAEGVRRKTLVRVLPSYRFKPMDVYALLPQGSSKLPRVAACLDVLQAAMQELQ
jgi:DNA-binding transcriptional LysR family regulator